MVFRCTQHYPLHLGVDQLRKLSYLAQGNVSVYIDMTERTLRNKASGDSQWGEMTILEIIT
ncbi:MAG: hypothetical protein AAF171_28560, partial [Cyanobacteria bacterium P01_A01_bin.116]